MLRIYTVCGNIVLSALCGLYFYVVMLWRFRVGKMVQMMKNQPKQVLKVVFWVAHTDYIFHMKSLWEQPWLHCHGKTMVNFPQGKLHHEHPHWVSSPIFLTLRPHLPKFQGVNETELVCLYLTMFFLTLAKSIHEPVYFWEQQRGSYYEEKAENHHKVVVIHTKIQ